MKFREAIGLTVPKLLPVFPAAVCVAAMMIFIASAASAQTSTRILTKNGKPILISAASMLGDYDKQTVSLVGNIQLTYEGQSIRCDRATLDKKNGKFFAEGNVIMASQTAYVEGSRAELSFEEGTGIIYDGFVKSGQVLFQGQTIRKTGPETFEAEQASYTACTTCPPAWSFSGSKIDAEIGAYAHIKSAWFYLGGVRFFWLPYLIVPLKSERQTGILFPTFEFQRDAFATALPFFWAISRSQDLTITPKFYLTLDPEAPTPGRDPKLLFNYRYLLSEESGGETNFAFFTFKDNAFAQDRLLPSLPGENRANRWFLSHNHIYSLPGGFINRAKLAFVSDLRYPRDYPEDIEGLGDSSLENRISLTKNTDSLHSSIEAAYYVNQLKADPLQGNADSVHRFPELRQSGSERSLFGTRVFLKWDFNYVNFAREDLSYDDVVLTGGTPPRRIDQTRGAGGAGSGSFEPGVDFIRTGQRLDLKPELSAPFRIGKYFDVLPSLQLRHTQYSFNVTVPDGTAFDVIPTRQYVRGSFAIRTQLSHIYELDPAEPTDAKNDPVKSELAREPASSPENVGIFAAMQSPVVAQRPERLKHEIEPEISISGIPWLQQTESPFFGENSLTPIFLVNQPVSDSDFYSTKGLQFDYEDRITQRNVVSFSLKNRFVKKSWLGDKPTYRQVVLITNGTSYEFDKPNRDSRVNFSDIFTVVDARFENFDTNTSIRYFPYHGVFNTSSRARLINKTGNFVEASFSQNFLITEDVNEAYPLRDENIGLAVGYVHRYATVSGGINYLPVSYTPIDFKLKSWSAQVDLRPPGDCWGLRVGVTHILSEEKPRFNFGFDYSFGGSTGGSVGSI